MDEVSEIPLNIQAKLLTVIQDRVVERIGGVTPRSIDIRIIAASNKDLLQMIQEKTFREDLYYRLNVLPVYLPALRERKQDIELLSEYFLARYNKILNKNVLRIDNEIMKLFQSYDWPGNIRQLENVVESCMVLVPGTVIDVDNLPAEIRDEDSQFKSAVDLLPVQLDLADTLEKIEAALIRRALVRADLVQVKAAELLGISKSLLQYKLKKYAITGH